MYYPELCKELKKFIRGDMSLSAIKDCFYRYWRRIQKNGIENEDNIAKVEILQIAVEAYGSGHYLEEDLWDTIHEYTSVVDHYQHTNKNQTKSHR